MRARCHNCGDEHDLVPMQQRRLLHMLPQLRSPLEILDPYVCANCGREIRTQVRFVSTDKRFVPTGPPSGEALAERRMGHVWSLDGRSAMSLNYPAVARPGGPVLFPAHEGRLSGALVIDQYGRSRFDGGVRRRVPEAVPGTRPEGPPAPADDRDDAGASICF